MQMHHHSIMSGSSLKHPQIFNEMPYQLSLRDLFLAPASANSVEQVVGIGKRTELYISTILLAEPLLCRRSKTNTANTH